MPGMHVRFEVTADELLGDLTDAAYRVALKHGLKVPFVEIELEIEEVMKKIIERDLMVSDACGSAECCMTAIRAKPWTRKADQIMKKRE